MKENLSWQCASAGGLVLSWKEIQTGSPKREKKEEDLEDGAEPEWWVRQETERKYCRWELEVWKVEEVGAKESKTVGGLLQVMYC